MDQLALFFLGSFQIRLNSALIEGFESDKARGLLVFLAVPQGKSAQELAAIERHRLAQPVNTQVAAIQPWMVVSVNSLQAITEIRHVQLVTAGGVELDGSMGAEKESRGSIALFERLANIVERLVQVSQRTSLGHVRPEQTRQS